MWLLVLLQCTDVSYPNITRTGSIQKSLLDDIGSLRFASLIVRHSASRRRATGAAWRPTGGIHRKEAMTSEVQPLNSRP